MIKESDVRDLNPWWKDSSKISADKKIREWENSAIKYIPRLKYKITYDFDPDNTVIYTLRGPRQVGKTTLIKLQIRQFLDEGVSPWNILYYSLDLEQKPGDIIDLVNKYRKLTESRWGERRCFLFLDEVTSIRNWQKGIKKLADDDKFKNCTVIITGSQALNIKKDVERLPISNCCYFI